MTGGTDPGRIEPGLSASIRHVVSPVDTAQAVGSGDVPVLGTPRLLALAEAATVRAVDPALPTGSTSVGTRVALVHRRPSGVGQELEVSAELVAVDGSRLAFRVWATQVEAPGVREVATGEVERVVVDTDSFLARVPRP